MARILAAQEDRFIDSAQDYAVIMLDIDDFKMINDRQGHVAGDAVLKNIAGVICESIRNTDYAIRYGGDEFLIVLSNITPDSAARIYDRVQTALADIRLDSATVQVSPGCALRSECASADTVIALSDQRMYANKRTE